VEDVGEDGGYGEEYSGGVQAERDVGGAGLRRRRLGCGVEVGAKVGTEIGAEAALEQEGGYSDGGYHDHGYWTQERAAAGVEDYYG
jgi:hypothetical protein